MEHRYFPYTTPLAIMLTGLIIAVAILLTPLVGTSFMGVEKSGEFGVWVVNTRTGAVKVCGDEHCSPWVTKSLPYRR